MATKQDIDRIKKLLEQTRKRAEERRQGSTSNAPAPASYTPSQSGSTSTRRQQTTSESATVPEAPAPAPATYSPVFDPSRASKGDADKSKAAKADIPDWVANILLSKKEKAMLDEGEKAQWGDLYPNLQEALKPVTRPIATKQQREQEQGPQESFESMQARMQAARQYAREHPFQFDSPLSPFTGGTPDPNAPQAPSGLEYLGAWLESGKTPVTQAVGGAIRGAPQTIMNLFNLPAQQTEQAIGVIEQTLGIDVNPAQMIVGHQTIATLAKAGSAIAKAVGANDVAAEFDKHTEAPPSVVTNLLANVVARQRANGQDSSAVEALLNASIGISSVITDAPSAEEVIAKQERLIETADQIAQSGGQIDDAWKGALYAYEGTELMNEATRRLQAGEDWDTIKADIDSRIGIEGTVNDLVGQMVLDPLNVLDAIGGVPGLLGVEGRTERKARQVMSEFWVATEEGAGLARIAQQGGDVSFVSKFEQKLRQFPVVGALIKPLPETIVARRGEEASSIIKMIGQGISPDAPTRLLEQGIDQHPVALAVQAFLNPNATDLAGTGKTAEQIQDILGHGRRQITRYEAEVLGVGLETEMDLFRSNAADRARDWFTKAGGDKMDDLVNEYLDMQKFFTEAMATRTAKATIDGEEVIVKGKDAIDLAEDKLINWLENVNETYKVAAGVGEAEGVYKNILNVRKGMAKIQGPFRFFHMGSNPGFSIRNLTSNKTLGWLDGFNMMTPVRSTERELARLGFGGAGLGRSLGAQSDIAKQLRSESGIKKFLNKVDPMNWSQRFEDISSQQIVLQAGQRQLDEMWRVGKAIPEDEWAETAVALGDRADEVKAILEGSWAPGELSTIIPRMTEGESWKNTVITALQNTHDTALRQDLDEIVQAAAGREDAIAKIQGYSGSMRDQFQQILDNGMVLEGTPSAKVLDAMQVATKNLPKKVREKMVDDFAQQLLRQDATESLFTKYADQALDTLKNIGDDVMRGKGIFPPEEYAQAGKASFREWCVDRHKEIIQRSKTAMQNFRPTQIEFFDAVGEGNFDRIRELGDEWAKAEAAAQGLTDYVNPFAGTVDKSTAWDDYFAWSNDYWSNHRASNIEDMRVLHEDMAKAIEQATGRRPPSVPEELVEKFIPPTTAQQRQLYAQLQSVARSRGINTTGELRDILVKYDVPHANNVWHKNVIDQNWNEQAILAILKHSQEEGLASKAAREVLDDTDELTMLLNKFDLDIDPTSMNLIDGKAAQMAERDAQIAKVIEELEQALPADFVNDKGIQKLQELITKLEPRHTAVRNIAEQVGTHARDFALLNYSDNRGIDLIAGMMYNYPKWYMGTMKNMVGRALENPGRMAALMKFRQKLRQMNSELPEWYQDQINIKTPWGPLYFNILAAFDPLNGFLGDKFRDPDMYNDPLSATMAEAQQFGPGLHGLWASTMATRAALMGDGEASMGWMSNLGPATRGVTAITALAKEYGGPGLDFIPDGGVVLEPWLWRLEEGQGAQMVGSKYDARRVGMAMAELVDDKTITAEQAYDAMLSQSGDIYDMALQRSKVNSSGSILASWLLGAGIKPRPGIEPEMQQMDLDRQALFVARNDGYYEGRPEAWRKAWEDMRRTYPWMDFVQGFRRDSVGRSNIYAMSVYDRMPPNSKAYIEALMGGEAEMYNDLLDKFYGGEPGQTPCSIENMSDPEQEMFMSMMKLMGATLSLPDTATSKEWNMARQARRAMYDNLNRQYAGIQDIQSQYFDILNSGEDNARADARQFLDQHGELQSYWDDKDRMVASDQLLSTYWGSMELFERVSRDQFEARMETEFPGVHDDISEYYRLRGIDQEAAYDFLDAHDNIKSYWNERDKWTVSLDGELLDMASGIGNLEGKWSKLRSDAEIESTGQQRIVDLIEAGSRPIGDFELPEDLNARQVQSGIEVELKAYTEGGGTWGNLYKQLRQMGDLDDTLTAFQEFARGSGNINVVDANMAEAKALLAALSAINEGSSAITYRTNGTTGGTRTKISSRNYGGASSAPKAQQKAQQKANNQAIDSFMASIMDTSYFGYLRNLSQMTPQQIAQFLEANPQFRSWISQAAGQYGLQALLDYFTRFEASKKRLTSKKRSSSKNKIISVKSSQPGLS